MIAALLMIVMTTLYMKTTQKMMTETCQFLTSFCLPSSVEAFSHLESRRSVTVRNQSSGGVNRGDQRRLVPQLFLHHLSIVQILCGFLQLVATYLRQIEESSMNQMV